MTGFFFKPYRFWTQIARAIAFCFVMAVQPAPAMFENADSRVMQIFESAQAGLCFSLENEQKPDVQSWDLQFAYDYDSKQFWDFRLYRIHCSNGAYNEIHVFYGVNHNDEVSQIYFPMPKLDIIYKNDNYEQSIYAVEVEGFLASPQLVNSEFDANTQSIFAYSKWRGIGDASSVGEWVFDQGDFILKSYDVDASYDRKYEMKRVYGEGAPVR